MTRLNTDIWVGLGICLFSLALLVYVIPQAVVVPRNVRLPVLSPDFWPEIIAWSLLVLGGLVAAQGLAAGRSAPRIASRLPADFPLRVLRLLGMGLVFAAYYLLIPVLGMVWSSAAAYGALALLLRTRYRLPAVLVAIALPLALYAFFSHVAGVPVPQGQFVRLP